MAISIYDSSPNTPNSPLKRTMAIQLGNHTLGKGEYPSISKTTGHMVLSNISIWGPTVSPCLT